MTDSDLFGDTPAAARPTAALLRRDDQLVIQPTETELNPTSPIAAAPAPSLRVAGGDLVWPWQLTVDGELSVSATLARPPVATIDDARAAVEWVWAIYGSEAAVTLADATDSPAATAATFPVAPGEPTTAMAAARCAFGLWLQAWWPSSVIDQIPTLPQSSLASELIELFPELELLGCLELDERLDADTQGRLAQPRPRSADRFALAAGEAAGPQLTLGTVVVTGTSEPAWAAVPAGWLDASAKALQWRLVRTLTSWTLQVRVAAGPLAPPLAELHCTVIEADASVSFALVRTVDGHGQGWSGEITGTLPAPDWVRLDVRAEGMPAVDLAFPDDAALSDDTDDPTSQWQAAVRAMARDRLRQATEGGQPASAWQPWTAESEADQS